jgi:hypothetical protein
MIGVPRLSLPHHTLRRCLACSTTPQSASPSNFQACHGRRCTKALLAWGLPVTPPSPFSVLSLPRCLVLLLPTIKAVNKPPTTNHQPPTTHHRHYHQPPVPTPYPPACQDSLDQTLGPVQIAPSSGNLTRVYLSLL